MTKSHASKVGHQAEAVTRTAHDALVKFMWGDVTRAKTMLQACLPPEVSRHCNWDALRLEGGSFVDPSLRAMYSDLLYSATVGEGEALLYVVFEHKSEENGRDVVQVLGYVQRVFERHQRWEQAKRAAVLPLPLILPIVLHHSAEGWSGPTELLPLFGEPGKRYPELARWQPKFEIILHDLSHKTDEELRESALDLASLLTMWALRDSRRGDKMYRELDR